MTVVAMVRHSFNMIIAVPIKRDRKFDCMSDVPTERFSRPLGG